MPILRTTRGNLTAASLLALAALAAGLSSTPARATSIAASQARAFHVLKNAKKWLAIDATHKKATLKLVAGYNDTNGGYNFDGYGNGDANFVVPLGWKVQIKFSNNSSDLTHSLGIATNHGNNLNIAKINGKKVETPDPTMGTSSGTTLKLNFKATPAGKFFVNCEMAAHSAAGMWDRFTIDKKAKTPQILIRS